MKKVLWLVIALLTSILITAQAEAVLINGGFETGNFTGWTTGFDYGFTYAHIYSGRPGVPGYTGVLSSAAYSGSYGAQIGSNLNVAEPSGMSWIYQDIDVLTGDKIDFMYRVQSEDNIYWDSFDFVIRDPSNNLDIAHPLHSGGTGWYSFSYTFPSTRRVRILFGTSEDGYSWNDNTNAYVDNVVHTPIPEPATLSLLGLGLLGLLGLRKKKV